MGILVIFRHGSRCQVEACEVRDAGGAERGAVQPGVGADEVDGGGGQDAGEMGLGLAAVGGAAQPGARGRPGRWCPRRRRGCCSGLSIPGSAARRAAGRGARAARGAAGSGCVPTCRWPPSCTEAAAGTGRQSASAKWTRATGVPLGLRWSDQLMLTAPWGQVTCLRVPVDAEGGLGQGRLLPGAAAPGLGGCRRRPARAG